MESGKRQSDLINKALFNIANAVNTTFDLDALYQSIHTILATVVNVDCFFIAVYDEDKDQISFPYNRDAIDTYEWDVIDNASTSTSFTWEVIRSKRPLLLTKEQQYQFVKARGGSHVGSPSEIWLGVPLIFQKKVIGAMVAQSYENPEQYDEEDIRIFSTVSEQIALAIERKAAVEDLKKRELQLETLYNISNVTHRASDIEEIFPQVSEAMSKVMDIMDFTVAVFDKTRNSLTFSYSTDDSIKGVEIDNADRSSSLTYQVIRTCESLVINNEDEITGMINDLGGKRYGRPARSWVGVPILIKGECAGALVAQNYEKPDTFKAEQVELLNLVSEQLASAIERKRAENDLRKAHDELEKRVKQRTLELAKTNEELQAEIAVRKQTEEKLIFAKQHAERANMAKSEFLANMSHELRTPMHHILNYTRMGLERIGKTGNEKLAHYLSQSNSSGRRLMRLLDDLLDISRLESGKMTFEMKKTDVAEIAMSVINQLKFSLNEKQQIIEVVDEGIDTVVLCDAYRIEQVFQNLLTNAIKFTPEGRKMTVLFEKSQQFSGGEHLKVSVKDQGIGIPDDELHSIFDKFTQSSKTKTGAGGTGLGLAICQEIIKGHKGFIFARENPEGGTIVTFSIPVNL